MKIEPTPGHVLVEPDEKPKEANGFLLAGDEQNSAPVRGDILEVGQGSAFEVGQTIYFRQYAVDELSYTDDSARKQTVWLVDENEILAVLKT